MGTFILLFLLIPGVLWVLSIAAIVRAFYAKQPLIIAGVIGTSAAFTLFAFLYKGAFELTSAWGFIVLAQIIALIFYAVKLKTPLGRLWVHSLCWFSVFCGFFYLILLELIN